MSQDVQHVSSLLGSRDRVLTLGLVVLLLLGSDVTNAGDSNSEDDARELAFFEAKIRPMLVQHCYKCHSVGAGKAEGGLRLDSRTTIRAGGDRGPAIVPGDSEASLLLTAISHTDPDLRMPPKKERLPESVINDFKSWIRMGAADPREDEAVKLIFRNLKDKQSLDLRFLPKLPGLAHEYFYLPWGIPGCSGL